MFRGEIVRDYGKRDRLAGQRGGDLFWTGNVDGEVPNACMAGEVFHGRLVDGD